MKSIVILLCLIVVCLALPSKRLSIPSIAETIKMTAKFATQNEIRKRYVSSAVQIAFNLTDGNGDGHITAAEFANYYVTEWPMFGLSTEQWIDAFNKALPKYDTNGNGTLEPTEYAGILG